MGILETAERVGVEYLHQVVQSDWRHGAARTQRVDERVLRRFTLEWDLARPGILQLLQLHFATYAGGGSFAYTPPGGSAITRPIESTA